MNPEIQLDMRLTSLMEAYPQTRPVFAAYGLGKLVSDESLRVIGPFLTLETALLSHGIAAQPFLRLVRECYHDESLLDAPGLPDTPAQAPPTSMS
jgi:hypothetical protein